MNGIKISDLVDRVVDMARTKVEASMTQASFRAEWAWAVQNNNWYTPDKKINAFFAEDGRLCVIINGGMQYLYPHEPQPDGNAVSVPG